jgi:hypothetical protein
MEAGEVRPAPHRTRVTTSSASCSTERSAGKEARVREEVAIMGAVLSVNVICDGVRDALDRRLTMQDG